ncbi:unnamed protein product, partial [Heterosigma akashiwo]
SGSGQQQPPASRAATEIILIPHQLYFLLPSMATMVKEMDVEEAKAQQQNKYDRQLRLWGARGQAALAGARVLLVGAGPTATETAKNLVLPGVGAVTVLDGHAGGPSGPGEQLFVTPADVGKPRAEAAAAALAELNPTALRRLAARAFPRRSATSPARGGVHAGGGLPAAGALQQQLAQACRAWGAPPAGAQLWADRPRSDRDGQPRGGGGAAGPRPRGPPPGRPLPHTPGVRPGGPGPRGPGQRGARACAVRPPPAAAAEGVEGP